MEWEEYLKTCKKAWEIMKEKEKEYGDSWKDSDFSFLENRLKGEVEEIFAENNIPKRAKECLDVLNMAVMLNKRYLMCGTEVFAEIEAIERRRWYFDGAYRRWGY